ncbi:glycoside hydrolase family 2 protein [Snuella sedimenti]|uniref:Beta galactosidase jelly roll domain-containing protein n=1 Tax=Snuella sedimenti TaxID=2798802 RepID=A0A8J7J0T5_9FLAO|nr:glycoside hydrolase family 2 TIM barrel-domain containing protein [Snuella sedimenti]MBJ6367477.1 beta galactosidase jelly roll domain-containing protein [Snuella sedimenti]
MKPIIMTKKNIVLLFSILQLSIAFAQQPIVYTKAGYLEVPDAGRNVFDFNIGWRFIKADVTGAQSETFDDSSWSLVNCPHGLELVGSEASGGVNYQGPAWYRKHFTPSDSLKRKQLKLHFEGVMGKCKVWVNGQLAGEHYGGYLPFSVDLSKGLKYGKENVIAVWADNSDDPDFPPGKPQSTLDFSYFGGIYRDVWLVSTNDIFVTNANDENIVAGGGLLVRYENISEKSADVLCRVHIRNNNSKSQDLKVKVLLKDKSGKTVSVKSQDVSIGGNDDKSLSSRLKVASPLLWSPWSPSLYRLELIIENDRGDVVDGVAQHIGIRKLEMRGKDGFWLNNKPYPGKLMGVNRHQDFAYVGNALPNNGQWRDAVLLKNAGTEIIRAAHYPVDPSFMEACDALGIFYIVATPGWQFWNDKPIFEQRVYKDVRNMVRRDRNHPCVIMWEPILNETWYPDRFAKNVHDIVHEELPGNGVFTACDQQAKGQEHFDVVYSNPHKVAFFHNNFPNTEANSKRIQIDYESEARCVFTREFGDCPDDWSAHNSPSRIARNWGEHGQLVQLKHYENPDFVYPSWEALHKAPKQHIGGALWHSFDHQRGYHPDPFYGGITDVFRQTKYSYQLFESQRSKDNPMIFIAHEMTPMSEPDVTVLTNCDEVRLIVYETDTLYAKPNKEHMKMPHPVIRFKDVYDFMDMKELYGHEQANKASLVAEGLIDGKVVVRHKRMPSKRAEKIVLTLQDQGTPLVANGSDIAVVVASITDKDGIVKRLSNADMRFEIEGEGELIGNVENGGNPRRVEWGNAPILVRSSITPGKITIRAFLTKEGVNCPASGVLEIESIASSNAFVFDEVSESSYGYKGSSEIKTQSLSDQEKKIKELEKELIQLRLKEVERQQDTFQGK